MLRTFTKFKTKHTHKLILIIVLALLHFSFRSESQSKKDNGYTLSEANKSYGSFYVFHSDALQKDFPTFVFLPNTYGKSNKEYAVYYCLHGANSSPLTEEGIRKMYHPETGMQEAADFFGMIIVCPLVGNQLYANSPTQPAEKYATLIGEELVRWTDGRFKTMKDRKGRYIGGFSMGGYGGVSLVCHYPKVFGVGLSRGGALDFATLVEDLHWDEPFGKDILGDFWKNRQNYHRFSCLNLLNKAKNRKDIGFVLEIGREDFLYLSNKKIEEKLKKEGYRYIYTEYPGGHEWNKKSLFSLLTHLQYLTVLSK